MHSIKVSCAGSNQFRAFYAHLSVCEQIEPAQDAINYVSLLKNAAFKGSAVFLDTLLNIRKKLRRETMRPVDERAKNRLANEIFYF